MANPKWHVRGEYFETCNCDYVCPCVPSNLTVKNDYVHCDVAMVFHVEHGHYGSTALDGLSFVVLAHSPGPRMADGNWGVGLITDERASAEQQQALIQIGSGQGGGPMASLGPLVGQLLGVEAKPIQFEKQGLSCSVSVPGVLDQAVAGVPSPVVAGEPLYLENSLHPANPRLAMALATRTHMHIFGIDFDNVSGTNNGLYAPFNWEVN